MTTREADGDGRAAPPTGARAAFNEASARFPGHTRLAAEALWAALRLSEELGDEFAGPRHLLWTVLADEGSAAARLLRRMNCAVDQVRNAGEAQPHPQPRPSQRVFVDMSYVRFNARDAAWGLGDELVGTAHLFLGLLAHGEIARRLRRLGVTAERFQAEMLLARYDPLEDSDGGPEPLPGLRPRADGLRPDAVLGVGAWLAVQLLCSCAVLPYASLSLPALLLELVVRNSFFLFFFPRLLRRNPDAWAGTMALLFFQSALACGLLATAPVMFATARGIAGPSMICPALVVLAPVAALVLLTRTLFRARWWFGVREREGWTVLRRRGGWVLLVLAVLYGGLGLAGVLPLWRSWM